MKRLGRMGKIQLIEMSFHNETFRFVNPLPPGEYEGEFIGVGGKLVR